MMQKAHRADFWKFFWGQSMSDFGSSFTAIALPLLIYQLTGSPLQLALSFVMTRLPYLVFGLLGGAFADRVQRKTVMIATNLLNAVLLVSIPALYFLHALPLWWLYCSGFLETMLGMLFGAASAVVVPELVRQDELIAANGQLFAASNTATLIGPPIAGILFGLMPIVNVLFFDALSFVLAALSLVWIRTSFNGPQAEPSAQQITPERRSI